MTKNTNAADGGRCYSIQPMMSLSKVLFSALVLSWLTAFMPGASAQDSGSGIPVHGVGNHSCGKYLEFRRENNEIMTALYQQWAAGYMAGYSTLAKPGSAVVAPDLKTYSAWLDKWCNNDPASGVLSGLIALRTRLQNKK